MYPLIDIHCHLNTPKIANNISHEVSNARSKGIEYFVDSALSEEEIKWNLDNMIPGKFFIAGKHPYYKASQQLQIKRLDCLLKNNLIIGIGEIGLDKRNSDFKTQKRILFEQLDLAKSYDCPVIFHIVKYHYKLYKLIKDNFQGIRGIIHGFKENREIYHLYRELNFYFSLGGKSLVSKKSKIAVKKIVQAGNYFFETDAPYQKPNYLSGDINHLSNLKSIVSKISDHTSTKFEILAKTQKNNFEKIFKQKLKNRK